MENFPFSNTEIILYLAIVALTVIALLITLHKNTQIARLEKQVRNQEYDITYQLNLLNKTYSAIKGYVVALDASMAPRLKRLAKSHPDRQKAEGAFDKASTTLYEYTHAIEVLINKSDHS